MSKQPPHRNRKEYWNRWRDKSVDNPRYWLKLRLGVLKYRAAARDIAFDIVPDDIETPDLCPVLGVKLRYGARARHKHNASFDRVIPTRGYVAGNVRVISHLANSVRQDVLDPAIFKALAADAERILENLRG